MADHRVLIVEDEPDLADALTYLLEQAGHSASSARLAKDGLRLFHQLHPDLVILDVGLPDLEGWDVLDRIRDVSDVPVLMLTARGLEHEKVRGLESGADDYVTKPFSNAELVARVQALLRRPRTDHSALRHVVVGDVRIDLEGRTAVAADKSLDLTPLEFRLLVALAKHPNQVLSTLQLLDLAWNDPYGVAPERVKFTVARLRRKLHEAGIEPIETVRGFGYRLAV